MSLVIGAALGVVLGGLIGLWLRRVFFRKSWICRGREDALLPYHYRYRPKNRWIERYYDEGYEQGLREKTHD